MISPSLEGKKKFCHRLEVDLGKFWISIGLLSMVLFNLGKAIRRGTHICLDKVAPLWILVKYERLPSFCYECGRLGHTMVECDTSDNAKKKNKGNYGSLIKKETKKNMKVKMKREERMWTSK